MSEIAAFVDITNEVCPITFVQVKVAIEELEPGQFLEIKMNAGEPITNVPRSLKEEGHKVISVDLGEDGMYKVVVKKDGLMEKT